MFLKSSKLTFPRTHTHNPGAVNAAIKQKQTYYSHVQIEFGDNLLCTHVVPSRPMPAARGNRTRASLISHEIAIGREYGRVTCGRPAAAECDLRGNITHDGRMRRGRRHDNGMTGTDCPSSTPWLRSFPRLRRLSPCRHVAQ